MFGYKYIGVNGSSKFPATAQILAHYLTQVKVPAPESSEARLGTFKQEGSGKQSCNRVLLFLKGPIGEQSKNACVQVNVASTFWGSMANLGNKIIADMRSFRCSYYEEAS